MFAGVGRSTGTQRCGSVPTTNLPTGACPLARWKADCRDCINTKKYSLMPPSEHRLVLKSKSLSTQMGRLPKVSRSKASKFQSVRPCTVTARRASSGCGRQTTTDDQDSHKRYAATHVPRIRLEVLNAQCLSA